MSKPMPTLETGKLLVEAEPLCQECYWERFGCYAPPFAFFRAYPNGVHDVTPERLLVTSTGVHREKPCARHADEALREEAAEAREDAAEEFPDLAREDEDLDANDRAALIPSIWEVEP